MHEDFTGDSYDPTEWRCAGFWRRFFAILLDLLLMVLITFPVYMALLAAGVSREALDESVVADLVQVLLPFVLHLFFWSVFGGTPGKLMLGLRVVDADSGEFVSPLRGIFRYLGYIVSAIPLYLGYFWMLWDPRCQTWHDKFANTIVVQRT